jgi:hypothetical protein
MLTRGSPLSESEQALLPTDDDVRHYAEHGWYLSRRLLTDEEVDELAAASERYYAGERDRRLPVRPPRLAYWEPANGEVQRHNDYVHYEHDALGRILRKPLMAKPPVLWGTASSPHVGDRAGGAEFASKFCAL